MGYDPTAGRRYNRPEDTAEACWGAFPHIAAELMGTDIGAGGKRAGPSHAAG